MAKTLKHGLSRLIALVRSPTFVRFVSAMGPTSVALAIQVVTFALTARGLGASAFGAYAMVLAVSAICVELVGLGGADVLVRAVSRDGTLFGRYFGHMLVLVFLTLPPVLGLAFLVARPQIDGVIDGVHLAMALLGEVLISRISNSTELAMVAHGHVFRASLVRLSTPIARLAAALLYFASSRALSGWIETVLIQSLALSAMFVVVAMLTYGTPRLRILGCELKGGSAFMVNQAARASQSNIDRVVLANFADSVALGVYAAGSRVLQLGLFPLQVMTRILYPQFFVEGKGGIAATRRFAIRWVLPMLATGIGAALAVAAASLFAPVVLGKDFAGAGRTAVLLSLSLPIMAMQYLAADALTGAGYQHIRALISVAMAVLFGVVLAIGARLAGVLGMIGAYLVAHLLFAAVLWAAMWLIQPDVSSDPAVKPV